MNNKKKVFSGYIDDCSPQQLEVLSKFRQRVHNMGCTDSIYDDIYLLRFLRARKFDLEKTTEMWKNFINWRREKKVDEVRHYEFPELNEAKQYYPHAWFRTDKLGRPIYIERPGKIQLDKLTKVMNNERLELHFINDYERLMNDIFPACSKAKGELVSNTLYIIDLKGVSARMMSSKIYELLKIATKIGQDNYPEILGTMFIVNTPLFFHGAWSLIKGFVDEKTRKKVHILGSNYKKELLQVIDENDLPDFLGGKATEADYGANLTNEQGPWIKSQADNVTAMPGNSPSGLSMSQRLSTDAKEGLEEGEQSYVKALSLSKINSQMKSVDESMDEDSLEIAEEMTNVSTQNVRYFNSQLSIRSNVLA